MCVGYTILSASAESVILKHCCLHDNQSTRNDFINGKYISNIIDSPGEKYLCIHCNTGLTHTNNIGDLPGY